MKHLNNLSNGIKEKFYPVNYKGDMWQDIETMPIWNWIKICETGDLKYIFLNSGRVSERTANHWLDLQQQYIDEFGLDEEFKQQLRLKKKLIQLNCDYVLTKDKFLLNVIKMREADLKSSQSGKAYKFYEVKDYVEQRKGFRVDPKQTTVIEWYHALKNMSNGEEN